MEAYPPQYVEHNLPLVLLSGLGDIYGPSATALEPKRQESGARVHIESPECTGDGAKQLLNEFIALDGTQRAWNAVSLPAPPGALAYKMRTVGRYYVLPARKAAPQPQSPGSEASPLSRNTELHSPLSPLSPGSPIFPDGVFTPLWLSKHQQQVPAIFLAFFNFAVRPTNTQDEQLKTDILAVRSALARSGFKSRLAVVLMSDKSVLQVPEVEERLASIRRTTSLDARTGLFFMPPMSSQGETAAFVHTVMTALQASCVEYYRDLSKRARRKKARGGPTPYIQSPVGGALQTTMPSGWNVRYEMKQGVFAEYCQEMEAAERHYSAAIEELFSSEGIFETTASWSPRWTEARLLCDSLAIRVIRCQLWNGTTTGAAQSWSNYRFRMKDLLDRRGMGSSTYSWDAWEARWAGTMSQMIQLADVPAIEKAMKLPPSTTLDLQAPRVYCLPEKSLPQGERLPPFNFLHHPGYWLRLCARGIRARWERALAIPQEDRIPPGQSPASAVANRSKIYDVYLVPDPHEEFPLYEGGVYDHATELRNVCIGATEAFDSRAQVRMSEEVRLDLANDLIRARRDDAAIEVLSKLWDESSWRDEEWQGPFSRLLLLLVECVDRCKSPRDVGLVPALFWELLDVASNSLLSTSRDLFSCLDSWDVTDRVSVTLSSAQRLSPVHASFAFKSRQTHIGEPADCQVMLHYTAPAAMKPIILARLELSLGAAKTIILQHSPDEQHTDDTLVVSEVLEAHETAAGLKDVSTDLTLRPGQKRVLNLSLHLREAQVLTVTGLTIYLQAERFSLAYRFEETSIVANPYWYLGGHGDIDGHLVPHFETKSIEVLPKPPKIKINLLSMNTQYYVDEQVRIVVELVNEEAETVQAIITPEIAGVNGEALSIGWGDVEDGEVDRKIPDMQPSESRRAEIRLTGPADPGTFTLGLGLRYTLESDPSDYLTKSVTVDLKFVLALEINFAVSHLLHPNPWPSFFHPGSNPENPTPDGITQLWKLNAPIAVLALDNLKLHGVKLLVDEVDGDAICEVRNNQQTLAKAVRARDKVETSFEFTTQKLSLDDRRPTHLDLAVAITWARGDEGRLSTTTLAAPRFTIPTSEPRVLCTLKNDTVQGGASVVQYTLENPSTHFLTFALTMEASEEFAFSGPKYRNLSLAPLSRHRVEYRLMLPNDEEAAGEDGVWVSPLFQVVDSYYHKNLRVYAAGPGVKLSEKKEIAVYISRR